jgi:sugar O-acyltransferase (sialic acid O-acetyltransferase NeuD family)
MCRLKKGSYDIFLNENFITNDLLKKNIKPIETIDIKKYKVLICISDPNIRKNIVNNLPYDTEYFTYIDKYAKILDKNTVNIGKCSIITTGSVLTTNINIGDFAHINLNSTIGHDCSIKNFLTTAPGVHISGETNIGNLVYFGTGSIVRNKINICDNVTIGMNSVVNKDIIESGIYVGLPAIKKK